MTATRKFFFANGFNEAGAWSATKEIQAETLEPYQPLLDKMRELNQQVYHLADFFDKRPVQQ